MEERRLTLDLQVLVVPTIEDSRERNPSRTARRGHRSVPEKRRTQMED